MSDADLRREIAKEETALRNLHARLELLRSDTWEIFRAEQQAKRDEVVVQLLKPALAEPFDLGLAHGKRAILETLLFTREEVAAQITKRSERMDALRRKLVLRQDMRKDRSIPERAKRE